jgi:zinc transport system ATP-binding protein
MLELRGVHFGYRAGQDVLRGVDLTVSEGEFVAIAGPNGGGKTTLIRLIVGLERPTRGQIRFFGTDPRQRRGASRIGYLPQRAQLGVDAPITVTELVSSGRTSVRGILGPLGRADRVAVGEAIERVGLTESRAVPLATLSGGQQQRAFIAKALASSPRLLVLDEPTIGVDADAQEAIAELLNELSETLHVTTLYVSHEFGAVERYVERLILIRGGVVFDGDPGSLPDRWHDPAHVHL